MNSCFVFFCFCFLQYAPKKEKSVLDPSITILLKKINTNLIDFITTKNQSIRNFILTLSLLKIHQYTAFIDFIKNLINLLLISSTLYQSYQSFINLINLLSILKSHQSFITLISLMNPLSIL